MTNLPKQKQWCPDGLGECDRGCANMCQRAMERDGSIAPQTSKNETSDIAAEIARTAFEGLGNPESLPLTEDILTAILTSAFDNYRVYLGETALSGDSSAPETAAPFPYPCDRVGWICSICHGWNVATDNHCVHTHATHEIGAQETSESRLISTVPHGEPGLTGSPPEETFRQGIDRVRRELHEHSAKGLASAGSSAAVNPRETVGGSAEPSRRPAEKASELPDCTCSIDEIETCRKPCKGDAQ